MNLDELFIPAKMTRSFLPIFEAKSIVDERTGNICRVVPEEALVRLLLEVGAKVDFDLDGGSFLDSKNESAHSLVIQHAENQELGSGLPQEIVELMKNEGANIIKAIMIYKNLQLKEVAERYGGKSAAANIANFSARSNQELVRTRTSTLQRIADALEVPVSWIGKFLEGIERQD